MKNINSWSESSPDALQESPDVNYSKMTDIIEVKLDNSFAEEQSRASLGPDHINYFGSDSTVPTQSLTAVKRRISLGEIPEIYIEFHYSQFFEVFFCHILHNVLFGPLCLPILLAVFPKNFISNFAFFPSAKFHWMVQTLQWLCIAVYTITACFHATPEEETAHQPCVRLMSTLLVMNYTLRQIIISLKYAYYTEEKYQFIKQNKLTFDEITSENSLYFWWVDRKGDLPLKQFYAAIRKHEIELSLFYIDFIGKLDPQTEKNYKEGNEEALEKFYSYVQQELQAGACPTTQKEIAQELVKTRYFAGMIAQEMISMDLQRSGSSVSRYFLLFWILGVIGSILPNFMSAVGTSTHWDGLIFTFNFPHDLLGWIMVFAFWTANSTVLMLNMVIFSLGLINSGLRWNMMRQLNFMISPRKKTDHEGIKKYPTINLFDPVSLKTWSNIKRIAVEYASKYQKRAETGVTCQLAFYFAFMIFLIIEIFFTKVKFYDYRSLIIVWYQLGIVLWVTIGLMINVANTNSLYQTMKGHVKEVRNILSDILFDKVYYLERDINPKNLLYRTFYEKLRAEFKHVKDREQFVAASIDYLKNLIACYDDIIDEITFEQENHPARALEIPLTLSLLNKLAVGMISLTFSLLTYFISRSK